MTRSPRFEPMESRLLLDALPTPAMPDLLPQYDSGVSQEDNITNVTTPTIRIQSAVEGCDIQVFFDGAYVGDAALVSGTTFEYSFVPNILEEGVNTITARSVIGSDESAPSPPLSIVLDTIAPFDVHPLSSYNTPDHAMAITVAGNLAYVADHSTGLMILDVSSPTLPELKGACDTPSYAYEVSVLGDLAYVADYDSGLQLIDISNSRAPAIVGHCSTAYRAFDVEVQDGLAYLAVGSSGLQIVDVSDPPKPTAVGLCDTPGSAVEVAVIGDWAYVADKASGLQIIDISTPSLPTIMGAVSTPGWACGVSVVRNLAYVADGEAGLLIVDVSTPSLPALIGRYDTAGDARRVSVLGNLAYVSDYNGGLQIIDVSDPGAPALVADYDTSADVYDTALNGNMAYVADGLNGLQVIYCSEVPVLDLASTSDTGPSNTDNITTDPTPTFNVCGQPPYVRIFRNGVRVTSEYAVTPVTLPPQPYGRHQYAAQIVDGAGNLSPSSAPLLTAILAPGDANADCRVDGGDLALWQQNYDPIGHVTNNWSNGDWNSDRRIDGGDLAMWQQNYDPIGTETLQAEGQTGMSVLLEQGQVGMLALSEPGSEGHEHSAATSLDGDGELQAGTSVYGRLLNEPAAVEGSVIPPVVSQEDPALTSAFAHSHAASSVDPGAALDVLALVEAW